MTDIAVGGIAVERTSEQSAIVSVEVEYDMPDLDDMTEEETADSMATLAALNNLWLLFRLQGWSVKELLDTIEPN